MIERRYHLIRFGIKATAIDIGEYLIKCPCCESDSWADVMVMSNYYHFSFVPIFPTGKDATAFCKKCGLKREGIPFNKKLISNFYDIKHLYRNPWYTYIGGTIMGIIVLVMIGAAIFSFFK